MRKYLPNLSAREAEELPGRFVFLGGTCNNSTWRDKLIENLTVGYFNPVVLDWTEDDIQIENDAKAEAEVLLYVITPAMSGFYSIVELTHDACLETNKIVIVCFLLDDNELTFNEHQIKNIKASKDLLTNNTKAIIMDSIDEIAIYLNKYLALENTEQV